MYNQALCTECSAPLSSDAKGDLCPRCLLNRRVSRSKMLWGCLLALLSGAWMLFWVVVVVSSLTAINRGGGREAVGDAAGGAMMTVPGLFVLVAAIFLFRSAWRPSKTYATPDAVKGSSVGRSVKGGLIGFAIAFMASMLITPILTFFPLSELPHAYRGLVLIMLNLVSLGTLVVGVIVGVIVAKRPRTQDAASRPGQWSSIGRSVLGGLIGSAAAFMTFLVVPPILILAVLYRILGLPHTYEYLDGFNLTLVSLGMLAVGAILGVVVSRRTETQQKPPPPERVDGVAECNSPTTEPKPAPVTYKRRPFGLIALCGCGACLAAILFWAHAPKGPVVLEPSVGAQPGEERTFAGITFCWCPAGSFTMGSPETEAGRKKNEGPQHTVTFKQGFWMSKYEVTHGQWESVKGFHPAASRGSDSLPMDMIDWHECQYFLRKLNTKGAGTFRLPSEAEWEYACRAGTQTPFFFGETISNDQANLERDAPKAVGSFPGNAWNLCDMHGSVREWCQDTRHEDYTGAPTDGSAWESTGVEDRVFRSGGWDNVDRGKVDRRSASRGHVMPGMHTLELGFRIVRTP